MLVMKYKQTFKLIFLSSQIVQYFVSQQGELEHSAVFTCRIYTFLFSISTLYTRRHRLKKDGLVQIQCCDKSGNGHTFCHGMFNLYNPPLRFGCRVVYKKQNHGLLIQSSLVLDFFLSFSNILNCNVLQKKESASIIL